MEKTTFLLRVSMLKVSMLLSMIGFSHTTSYSEGHTANNYVLNLPTSHIDFDGVNSFIDFGDNHDFTGSFSMEAWILQESTSTSEATILSKRDAKLGNERGYHLIVNASNYINLTWYNSSGIPLINITSSHPISNNKWHHVAATYDGTIAKIYVDGVEVGTGNPMGAPVDGPENFMIGGMYDSDTPSGSATKYFNGFIDEVRLWNIALSTSQLREMMNQELQNNLGAVQGSVLGIDISGGLSWDNLTGYYQMNTGKIEDQSKSSISGFPKNINTIQTQTAPLPYTTKADGNWTDTTESTPWTYGDSVWNYPNAMGIDGVTPIDWNIVVTNHNIEIDNNITVLGLDINSNELQVNGITNMNTGTGGGHGLYVTHYLKIDGVLDLEGESQLIQTENSIYDRSSTGRLERDQQGTQDYYTYNYWSSPVKFTNGSNTYNIPQVLHDGTTPITTPSTLPANINFISSYNGATGSPISIADYWIWKYANSTNDDKSKWEHIRSKGSISVGEGFTMKGVADTGGTIAPLQNYVFSGKPNNGDITISLTAGNEYLVGNPYPSALDADEFIKDNISNLETGGRNTSGNVINGVLYFWDHFAPSTHLLGDYQGGYATYSLMGGAVAIINDTRINATGTSGTKIPGRYIPVGQGFFVSTILDEALNIDEPDASVDHNNSGLEPIVGGNLVFKNSQRVFKKEETKVSIFVKSSGTKNKTNGDIQKIKLMLDSPDGYHRQILVGANQKCSKKFDLGYDAPLIENNKEDMYWVQNNSNFVIQAVHDFDNDQILPLGLKIDKAGIATIKIDALEHINENTAIIIHDKELNTNNNLRDSDFEILLEPGIYNDRFELIFSTPLLLNDDESDESNDGKNEDEDLDQEDEDDIVQNKLNIYFANDTEHIVIRNPEAKTIKEVELYNILGQSVYNFRTNSNEKLIEHRVKQIKAGVYIIKLNTENETISKKVVIE
ncbi:LamG-like jellyroll fold domain-containing protein [Algibacter sp. 2305UL17-15]|uniref:LamG-like jellyroll fold domain-containing protein n=1 Tax=Algibacter sp. 2305UL17-15 TaxID=3231268 RepID=UPI0034599A27